MSLFTPINLVCPNCQASIVMDAVGSVNADRRPDFRDDILNDRFQDVTCEECHESFRLQPKFNYLDAGRRQWIAAFPSARILDWIEAEVEVKDLFEASYGGKAPVAAQDVGASFDVRMTFGWPAVREKLLAREHGLSDVVLEVLKFDLIRRTPSSPISAGVELRLVNASEEILTFVWFDGPTEKPLQEIHVPVEHYATIADDPASWEKLSARIEDSAFVDLQKLYMGEGREAAE